jgi:hypothetical protein
VANKCHTNGNSKDDVYMRLVCGASRCWHSTFTELFDVDDALDCKAENIF